MAWMASGCVAGSRYPVTSAAGAAFDEPGEREGSHSRGARSSRHGPVEHEKQDRPAQCHEKAHGVVRSVEPEDASRYPPTKAPTMPNPMVKTRPPGSRPARRAWR